MFAALKNEKYIISGYSHSLKPKICYSEMASLSVVSNQTEAELQEQPSN